MAVASFGAPLERADTVRVETKPSGGGDARVLLTQASCGRVARIGERRASRILAFPVERVEIIPSHENLAANLHEFRNILLWPGKILWNGGDGAHIECDIFASHTIASGQALFKHAITVNEIERKSVNLHFAGHWQGLRVRPIKTSDDTVIPFAQFLKRKDIVKTHHA